MVTEGKNIVEYTMSNRKVTIYSIFLIVPVAILFVLPFIFIWDISFIQSIGRWELNIFLLILLAGMPLHELLHGVTWALFVKRGLKSINYGIEWKYLMPYCHCVESLKLKHYALGAAMPLIVMGIMPTVLGIVTGIGWFLLFGAFFTMAAAGDIISLFMMRKLNRNAIVFDHPHKMGFYTEVYEK
ncbi:MAG: DUF3267 domain-containing protein [Bacteroidales bacterium]